MMKFKKTLAAAAISVLTVASLAVSANAETAGFIFQTNMYSFRDTPFQSQALWWNEFDEAANFDNWSVQDAEITGDGTYTVSFDCDFAATEKGDIFWNILKIVTNISVEEQPDVVITCDKMTVDGKEVSAAAGVVSIADNEALKSANKYADSDYEPIKEVYTLPLYNTYIPDQQFISSEDFGSKVECTFTVKGFKSAESAAPEATEAAQEAQSPVGDDTKATPDKSNADTGVEGVTAFAAIAVIAVGAIVISKKRK